MQENEYMISNKRVYLTDDSNSKNEDFMIMTIPH